VEKVTTTIRFTGLTGLPASLFAKEPIQQDRVTVPLERNGKAAGWEGEARRPACTIDMLPVLFGRKAHRRPRVKKLGAALQVHCDLKGFLFLGIYLFCRSQIP
jgi:hypothetical protein